MSPEERAMMEAMSAPPEGRFISVSARVPVLLRSEGREQRRVLGSCDRRLGCADPGGGGYTALSAGGYHACGIRIDQTVVCWGSNRGFDDEFLGQATPPDGPFEVINAGTFHTCGFRPDGEIRCWGSIARGEIQTCEQQSDGATRCWMNERGDRGQ